MRTLSELVDEFERTTIQLSLSAHAGNISRAAKALGVERTNLHKKMRKHGLRGQGHDGQRRKLVPAWRSEPTGGSAARFMPPDPLTMHGAGDGQGGSDF